MKNYRALVIFSLLIILGVIFGLYLLYKTPAINTDTGNDDLLIENDGSMDVTDVITGDISNIESNTGDVEIINNFSFSEECIVENTGDYKILEVFISPRKSPIDAKNYIKYTKPYTIIGRIQDAKLCIVSDVVDYRKKHQYTYSTYIIFGSSDYAGHIRVGYSKKNGVVYDKTSGGTSDLDGRFRGDETPKIYNLDNLNTLKVADTLNGGTKKINIVERLNKEGNIRIGGFVNAKNGEGRINKFILAYRCTTGSNCIIK